MATDAEASMKLREWVEHLSKRVDENAARCSEETCHSCGTAAEAVSQFRKAVEFAEQGGKADKRDGEKAVLDGHTVDRNAGRHAPPLRGSTMICDACGKRTSSITNCPCRQQVCWVCWERVHREHK